MEKILAVAAANEAAIAKLLQMFASFEERLRQLEADQSR